MGSRRELRWQAGIWEGPIESLAQKRGNAPFFFILLAFIQGAMFAKFVETGKTFQAALGALDSSIRPLLRTLAVGTQKIIPRPNRVVSHERQHWSLAVLASRNWGKRDLHLMDGDLETP